MRYKTRFRPSDGPEMRAIHDHWATAVHTLKNARAAQQEEFRIQRAKLDFEGRLAAINARADKEIKEYQLQREAHERSERVKKEADWHSRNIGRALLVHADYSAGMSLRAIKEKRGYQYQYVKDAVAHYVPALLVELSTYPSAPL